jgi:formyl-CoA transferase
VNPGAAGPLAGITVLDLSRVLAGPFATMIMADLGARVIKVERRAGGDDTRGWGPPFLASGEATDSTYFLSVNKNKESIALDFADPSDRSVLTELIRRADVLVENFRPGVMSRWGLDHEQLLAINPHLVCASISGFGPDGPEADRAGYDQILQGEAGLMSLTGPDAEHPVKVGVPVGDLTTGMFAVIGVLAKLCERASTGRGGGLNVSLLASLVTLNSFQGARWLLAHELPTATGNDHPTVAPYGAFETADGLVQIAVGSEDLWRRFAPIVGLDPDDPRFARNSVRQLARRELRTAIEGAMALRPSSYWLARCREAGVPIGEIRSLDAVYGSPQVISQGLVVDVDHPDHGRLALPGPPIRFDDGGRGEHTHPPRLDEHGEDIRGWLAGTGRPPQATGGRRATDPSSR